MVVVVKIGTSSLTDEQGIIRREAIEKLCLEVAGARESGHQVVIVTSGAIGAGLPALGLGGDQRPRDSQTLQAVSAVGQSRLMGVYSDELDRHSLIGGQVLLAPLDFVDRRQYLQARGTLTRLLDLGVVPIVNENDAVADDEIRFGDNDRLAALVSHLVDAELLVLLTDTSGLLSADPRIDPNASLIEEIVEFDQQLDDTRNLPARKLWIAFAVRSSGLLSVDAGARSALERGGTSLLAAGVLSVEGEFDADDAVEIADESGEVFAKGLVRMGVQTLKAAAGHSRSELPSEVPAQVIHADDLVILP